MKSKAPLFLSFSMLALASGVGVTTSTALTLVVYNNNDSGTGSLRQAISDASVVENTITFASNVVGTIPLSTGPLGISKSLSILGPGSRLLAVSGNNASGVFEVLEGNVTISGLTIRNGSVAGTAGLFEQSGAEARGGGIFNQANLVLRDCYLSSNSVVGGQGGPTVDGFAGSGGNAFGGGVCNIGTIAVSGCSFADNSATGGAGGIATGSGSSGTPGQGLGGGFYNDVNPNGITNCTVARNFVAGSGFDIGGGIFDGGPGLVLRCCTVASNSAAFGGGLYSSGAAFDLGNTLLGGNSVTFTGPDCSGSINSSDYNLIQNTGGATISGITTHSLTGLDPLLGPLGNYGGPGASFPLKGGSPAIDKGKSFGTTTDQRGLPRPFDFPTVPNAAGGDGSDIGAFELNPPPLSIARAGANVLVFWPTYASGFRLQSVASLSTPGSWAAVPGAPGTIGNQFYSTNPITGGNNYFRLIFP